MVNILYLFYSITIFILYIINGIPAPNPSLFRHIKSVLDVNIFKYQFPEKGNGYLDLCFFILIFGSSILVIKYGHILLLARKTFCLTELSLMNALRSAQL